MPSLATRALRQAGYLPDEGNSLIRDARRGRLDALQGPGGTYHDPYNRDDVYTQAPGTPAGWRTATPTDPNYYGGFKSPDVQTGLQGIEQRFAARRARHGK